MSTLPIKTVSVLKNAKSKAGRLTIVGFCLALLGMLAIASPLVAGVSISILVGDGRHVSMAGSSGRRALPC